MGRLKTAIFSVIFTLLGACFAFAAGGNGATCNPSTASWPNCKLADVAIRKYVTNTVNIPAGLYSSAYVASSPNTEYILQGDISADGTAITVTANYVVINLNGHTITYNQTTPGEGVNIGAWNKHHIAVVNGSIIQGAAMSEGNQYGHGNNPVSTYNTGLGGYRSAKYLHIANLYVRYGGRDVGGIITTSHNGLYEHNTIEDTYEFGTLKNRHQGVDALTGTQGIKSTRNIYRYNTIVNCRHRGIKSGNGSKIYGNHITTRTIATNGFGIFGYAAQNAEVYNNTVISRGEHPLGIGFVSKGTNHIEIYNNYLDSKTTAIGTEYAGNSSCFDSRTPCGNFAVGFRTTWGGNNINFHDNEIHIATDSSYSGTYSPNGRPVKVNAKGRGLFVGIRKGETSIFKNNTITVLDKDGTGKAYGMACTYSFSDGLFFIGNTVTSNIANMVLSDDYGQCLGFPLVQGNTFIKQDNYPAYTTISNKLNGYQDTTGRIVDNTYQNGAAVDSIDFHPSGEGMVSVYFGHVAEGNFLYDYRLHDNNGKKSSLIREDYDPPITLKYREDYDPPPLPQTTTIKQKHKVPSGAPPAKLLPPPKNLRRIKP